jgi:hypothetical protein
VRFVVLHYRIAHSTAGEESLSGNFGHAYTQFADSGECAATGNARLLEFLDAHPGVRAVSSACLSYPRPSATGYVFFDLCILQDPLERLLSLYSLLRGGRGSDPEMRELAEASDLGRFLRYLIANRPDLVNDVQVQALSATGAYRCPPGPANLESALATMRDCSGLGLTSRWEASLTAIQYFWKPAFPTFRVDVIPGDASSVDLKKNLEHIEIACGRKLFRELLNLNQLDLELLRAAQEELARRFELVPDHAVHSHVAAYAAMDTPPRQAFRATRQARSH